ncbi:N-acyl amino acid synthase FeeM domain-containing protein [Burkholderia ubonensis]|nr:hypothetical protein [Burkholderia ubonensis]
MKNELDAVVRTTEIYPFTITLATDPALLGAAVQIRQSAYARHLPELAKTMTDAESWDVREGTVVLVARSKLDGMPIGTIRIHTNEVAPLPLEQSFKLPGRFAGLRLAEATRLGVVADSVGSVVKTALFKAYYLYCVAHNVDYMVITARSPLDRMYERLLFKDVDGATGFIPMAHVGGVPHRVLEFHVKEAEALWRTARHPFYRYMSQTEHPDIVVTESDSQLRVASSTSLVADRA